MFCSVLSVSVFFSACFWCVCFVFRVSVFACVVLYMCDVIFVLVVQSQQIKTQKRPATQTNTNKGKQQPH